MRKANPERNAIQRWIDEFVMKYKHQPRRICCGCAISELELGLPMSENQFCNSVQGAIPTDGRRFSAGATRMTARICDDCKLAITEMERCNNRRSMQPLENKVSMSHLLGLELDPAAASGLAFLLVTDEGKTLPELFPQFYTEGDEVKQDGPDLVRCKQLVADATKRAISMAN